MEPIDKEKISLKENLFLLIWNVIIKWVCQLSCYHWVIDSGVVVDHEQQYSWMEEYEIGERVGTYCKLLWTLLGFQFIQESEVVSSTNHFVVVVLVLFKKEGKKFYTAFRCNYQKSFWLVLSTVMKPAQWSDLYLYNALL